MSIWNWIFCLKFTSKVSRFAFETSNRDLNRGLWNIRKKIFCTCLNSSTKAETVKVLFYSWCVFLSLPIRDKGLKEGRIANLLQGTKIAITFLLDKITQTTKTDKTWKSVRLISLDATIFWKTRQTVICKNCFIMAQKTWKTLTEINNFWSEHKNIYGRAIWFRIPLIGHIVCFPW